MKPMMTLIALLTPLFRYLQELARFGAYSFLFQVELVAALLVQTSERDDVPRRFHPGGIVLYLPVMTELFPQVP